ncbi:MAG: kinase [Candidatus Yanofskybacteria bacterium RIFCSPHIGHO2_02_FULL_41_29]|uniref:Kinase n=1 Tax=Candidatus Yanofskybacteria bacterium RIFCSPHIGHO2_01_FULL_41_53 TaxID=1802663 RepID=A0A1F8EJ48_9BACT|nr:MAG: kinase [Candidatus Yanofskybacteria bacterium RIFCSPHIGHO2_01_FULL_41_53]OGN10313.1 MAG: kinase [Candidatus Yanofskybacteria bacterium RIFCSPHIGHO2_02_FULL_41_29]OGN16722.1 MAG: kinase [Candidatus Yanofskybacteria bacterium RIFCSPHIGHO2_12_FULL_41_9]OGN21838.1 MAG: kinase [Candidatus Yanofskybacteria bacterium RIFCSPLOWO2_01_FULL_41_67]OGN30418.1 MAG: kinase [Candidatus Yanofskybacteria bacterium RIFCSPLOWO2_02_FULL_41_13]
MIITRTPFRISFFGGGTDYPTWYKENGGSVLSAAINKYCYITCRYLPPFFKYKHRIVYSQIESVDKIDHIDHPSVRETIRFLNIDKGLEIHHDGDLPAMSGLGSSSSFTVGLINAISALNGTLKTKREVAMNAIHIEQNMIKENVGSQDQTAAAFGGLNRIDFGGAKEISIKPLVLSPNRLESLQDHLMLFFTGLSRDASKIAKEQVTNIKNRGTELKLMHRLVDEGEAILANSRKGLDEFGKLLNEGWKIKKSLSSKITNPYIDDVYKAGIRAGALGGKLLGAGGGGFILFFAKPETHEKIKSKLKNLLFVPFRFDHLGSRIIYTGNDFEKF